jgi:hypothetical protein
VNLLDLEAAIKGIPGVLGCVILAEADGAPSEIQAFTRVGVDRADIQGAIVDRSNELGLGHLLEQVLVFELETESLMGGPDSLAKAELLAELEALNEEEERVEGARPTHEGRPDPSRPVLRRVVALTTTWRSEVEVSLGDRRREVVGQAVGRRSAHGLHVIAQATLDAVHQLFPDEHLSLGGTWLTTVRDREVVLVFVDRDGIESVGAALVRDRPLTEAAVRATLDAINRRLFSSEGQGP